MQTNVQHHFRHPLRVLAVLLAILALLPLAATPAYAASTTTTSKKSFFYNPQGDYGANTFLCGKHKGSITGATSSNKKIAVVSVSNQGNYSTICARTKRPGTTVVKYRCAGKTYRIKITVKKWSNPVKLLSVGGQNIASQFRSGSYGYSNSGVCGKRIKVRPASGWKLVSITYLKNGKNVKIKNGGKIPWSCYDARITLKNPTTGVKETLMVY